ncbi:MAG TPA: CARDB domain-containing protein, partial [Myxococcaceae bacterium]
MIAPPSVLQNSTVAVTVKVCNQGDSGGQAAVALYRSTDATITLADTFIGSTSTTGFLLPGACNLVAVSGPIPGPQGTFYLGGYADPYNALVEANESNNAAAPPNATVVGSKPDFIITSVSGPNSATQSSSFSVTTMLCNQGTQSGSAPVGIYLSADNTITTSDFQVGQFSAPSLAPGACTPLTGNVTASVSAGAYWLGAIADRSNAVSELIETNNALAGNQMGVGSKPDLVVTAVSGPAIAVPGASLQMTATLCNQGTQPGTAPVTLYFSTDGTITTADIQVGLLSAPPSLAPGACATLTGTATASGASGVYWLGAIADRAGTVSELIETNNAKAGNRIGTGNAPDFSVTSVSTAPGVSPGAPVTVAATVCNQGTAPGNAAVGILFSWDDTITPSDWFAGVLPAMPFLLPGACDVVSGTLSGPTIQTAYNVGAIADFYNATAELFEDNNAKAGNRVGVGNAPDLVVSSVSSAPSALPGSQVTVTATVCNQGTMGASGKATLYFSSDATITTGDLLGGDFNPSPFLLPGDCDTGSLTLPAPPPGVYTVGAIVDRFALTAELLEDNNATAGNQLAVGNKPDFIVSSVSAPTSALPGGPLQVTATVCNQGTLGTSVTVMEVFFSTDATITASDLLGGSFPPAPFLDAGACATLSANVPAPPSGTYYAGAIADRPGIVPELIETNNATAGNRLAVGNGADFVISSLSAGVAAFPGGSVQVAVTVCNQGTLGASAPVDLYFSTDAFISNNDFYSTGMGAPYLGPGACASMTANAWAPSAAGTYFIGAIADQFNGAPELFEDNNTRAGNRVGVGNSPDFSVQAVSAAPSAMPGSPVTVTATLCNQGTIPGSAPAAVYFSTDATITIGDLFGGFLPPLPFLMPGACDVVTGTVPAPTVGTYRVGVIVDPYVSMLELFEDNNALAGNRVAVGNGPDFIISAVSTAASALPGAMAQVTATVCNQGTMGANAPVVELYFSTDATITGTDFFAGILANAPFLEPGACATQTQGSPLPGSAGTWYAGAIADRPNSIPELLEDNNALAGSRIAVGNGPDFVVSSVTSAGGVFPNGSMQVTATVCNQGTQGASVPFVEVFFSTDATITGEDSFGGTLPPSPYLNPGDCAPLSGNVMAPPIPGAYYAGAIVDRFQWVSELLEDNNAKAGNRVGVGNLPDFVVSSVSTAVTAYPGGMLEVTATVCNQGTQSGGAPLDIYFSTDTFVSMNDYYASSLPMPWLEAGACATVTGNTWAPSQDGTYYIGAIADQYGGMPELFEDNNTRAGNRVGVGNAPDFYVKAVSAPASALPGSPVTVTATICNQGTLPGSAPVGVYFSTDAAITTVDFLGGFLPPIPFLLPGSCEVVSGTFPAPPAGTYWAGVIADPYGSTQELFEDNNALAGNRVGVGSGPDFVISSVSTAPSALPGAQVTINATVCNQGTVGGSTPVDLYFSTDATITTMDQPAWSFPPDAYLKPGECTTKTASVGAPPGGTWWVGAIADAWNSNPELFDDNNAKAGNRLVVGNGPDFVVASMHATPSAIPGGMTSVTATVCNQGTQGASVPMVEVFFSTDTAITDKDFLGGPLPPGPAPYLEAGACAELTGSAMVPYTPGAYFAGAIIDRFQWVSELLEDNNTTAGGRIGVGNLPDYIISSVSTGVTVLPGGMLEVTVTACNQGTTGGSVPLDVYFSTDSSISTNDYHASSL